MNAENQALKELKSVEFTMPQIQSAYQISGRKIIIMFNGKKRNVKCLKNHILKFDLIILTELELYQNIQTLIPIGN